MPKNPMEHSRMNYSDEEPTANMDDVAHSIGKQVRELRDGKITYQDWQIPVQPNELIEAYKERRIEITPTMEMAREELNRRDSELDDPAWQSLKGQYAKSIVHAACLTALAKPMMRMDDVSQSAKLGLIKSLE